MLLAALLLVGTAGVAALDVAGLVNQQVKRVVYFNSPILREEYSLVVSLAETATEPIHNYLVIIPPSVAPHFAHVAGVIEDTKEKRMVTEEMKDGCPIGARCFMMNFPKPLTRANPKLTFGIGISYVNRTKAVPAVARQEDPLGIRIELSPYFYSPYPTMQQKSNLLLIKEFELIGAGCPRPHNLTPTTSPSAVGGGVPGASQLTCGVYENVPALSEDPKAMWINYKVTRVPFLQFKKLERTVELDPLRRKLYVADEYTIEHKGHLLKDGAFSKTGFMRSVQKRDQTAQAQPVVPITVPASADRVQFRDEVGLLHTQFNRHPSPLSEKEHIIDAQPRFPLEGGWSTFWRVTYELPAKNFVDQIYVSTSKVYARRLVMNIFEMYHDISVDELVVNIILPGEATLVTGTHAIATGVDMYVTKRESYTRPRALLLGTQQVHSITLKHVTKEHQEYVGILYNYPWYTPYKQPIYTAILVILLLMVSARLGSININLKPNSKALGSLARLFRDRRGLLTQLVDHRHNKEATDQILKELHELSNEITLAISERNEDKEISLAGAALSRVHDEQHHKIRSLLNESNPIIVARLEKDAVDIDERVIRCEARLLSFDLI